MNDYCLDIVSQMNDLFREALSHNTYCDLANALGLHPNTVKRWITEARPPPTHYEGDLLRIMGRDASDVRFKDQFFTRPEAAAACAKWMTEAMRSINLDPDEFWFVEPSAGCGHFYEQMPTDRRTGLDIAPIGPAAKHLQRADYLRWQNPNGKQRYAVLGNPPFGLRGHLALQFINKSAEYADVVGFVLPQLFDSDGKGAPSKRVSTELGLVMSRKMDADSFCAPDGRPVGVSTVFQVWAKKHLLPPDLRSPKTCDSYAKVVSLSDGGTPSSTRNKSLLYSCDVYLPSTCYSGMHAYGDFESLPHRRGYGVLIHKAKALLSEHLFGCDWSKLAFRSTNGALNLRSSLIRQAITSGGFCDWPDGRSGSALGGQDSHSIRPKAHKIK